MQFSIGDTSLTAHTIYHHHDHHHPTCDDHDGSNNFKLETRKYKVHVIVGKKSKKAHLHSITRVIS